MAKVFLGGAIDRSNWRKYVIERINMDYYNPDIEKWSYEVYRKEWQEKNACDVLLFVISPKAKGIFPIAELVDHSNKQPEKTVFCLIKEEDGETFTNHQFKSLEAIGRMIEQNKAKWFNSLDETIEYLNKKNIEIERQKKENN